MNPYLDTKYENSFTRRFDNISSDEAVWHRDKKDRKIEILSGSGWKLQFDNDLPKDLNIGDKIYIPKMVFHRIILGIDPLVIAIQEL